MTNDAQDSIEGINHAFMVATLFAVVALVLSFFLKRGVTSEEEAAEGTFASDKG